MIYSDWSQAAVPPHPLPPGFRLITPAVHPSSSLSRLDLTKYVTGWWYGNTCLKLPRNFPNACVQWSDLVCNVVRNVFVVRKCLHRVIELWLSKMCLFSKTLNWTQFSQVLSGTFLMKIKFPTRKRALNSFSDWKGTTGCFELMINEGE